jgi:hypothetical protein
VEWYIVYVYPLSSISPSLPHPISLVYKESVHSELHIEIQYVPSSELNKTDKFAVLWKDDRAVRWKTSYKYILF